MLPHSTQERHTKLLLHHHDCNHDLTQMFKNCAKNQLVVELIYEHFFLFVDHHYLHCLSLVVCDIM